MRIALFAEQDSAISRGAATTLAALVGHLPGDVSVLTYRVDSGLTSVCRADRVLRRAVRDRVDLIHVTTWGPGAIIGLFVAQKLGIPVVASFDAGVASTPIRRRYVRLVAHQCEHVFASSHVVRDRLLSDGMDSAKVLTWRPGVDAALFTPARRSAGLRARWEVSDERPAIVFAGTLSDEKGASRLMSLEVGLHRTHPMHRLIVVGDGPVRGLLERRCPQAIFMGEVPHDEMPTVLASADLFVCPSESFSTNHVVLEAQASGIAAAVMEQGSASERVSRASGVVCRSTVDLIVGTATLIRNEVRRKEMGAAARRHALRQGWHAGLAPLYAAYRTAVQVSGARRDFRPALAPQNRRL